MFAQANQLVRELLYVLDMTHLAAIENRQKKSAVRDLAFTIGVGIAAFFSVSAITAAVAAASTFTR